jgi:zinc transport system permease protein
MLIIMLSLSRLWNKIISAVISPEIAHCEGVNIRLMQHTFTLLLTLVFAVAIKIVGVLLLTSLLIIPAAAARFYAKSPFSMAVIASSIGVGSVIIGMFLSLLFDWPAGPAIVISSAFAFFTAYAQYKVIH